MRLENFSSFGFAKGWLVCQAKPNVLKCAAGFFFLSSDGRTVGLLGLLVTFRAFGDGRYRSRTPKTRSEIYFKSSKYFNRSGTQEPIAKALLNRRPLDEGQLYPKIIHSFELTY